MLGITSRRGLEVRREVGGHRVLGGCAVRCTWFGTPVEDFLRRKLSTKHSSRFWPAKGLLASSVGAPAMRHSGQVQDCASVAILGSPSLPRRMCRRLPWRLVPARFRERTLVHSAAFAALFGALPRLYLLIKSSK